MEKSYSNFPSLDLCLNTQDSPVCTNENCCSFREQTVLGEWLLVEFGASPGAGYIVTPVPSFPQQKLLISSDGTMSSTVEGLEPFRFYALAADSNNNADVIEFFQQRPGPSPSTFDQSYTITFENDKLKLAFRTCLEGCHFGFVRLN